MAESNPTRPWGPDNPHPLSTMKTELVWEGKYDEFGNRREVDVAGSSMPMQKIETIDQPRSEAASKGGEFLLDFENTTSRNDDFRNRLIWGDNKLVMASLLKEFRGSIDLIYIDPPFDVNADFSVAVPVGSENEVLTKGQSVMELVAYNDTWGLGADSYLHMLWERLNVLRELLADDGSLFVHVGPEVSESVRLVLDSVFGQENLRNQIILPGRAVKNLQQQFQNIGRLQIRHDVLYWYSKRDSTRFPQIWSEKHDKGNPEGHWHHFWSTADRPTMRYELFGTTPKSGQWVWKESRAKIAVENFERFLKEAGGRTLAQYWRDTGKKLEFIRRSPDDGKPQYWRAPAEDRLADTIWAGLPIYSSSTSYPTEKSERFLSFIVENFTKESDLIADFFCGSGTAGSVAEKLGRRWIMADLGRYAIHTSRKRMIDVQRDLADQQKPYRAFGVYNLGRYERQWWQAEYLEGADEEHRKVVLEFFRAEILGPRNRPSPLIHGRKGTSLCHVDQIDSIFTRDEAEQVAVATSQAGATECYCLSWEFEMDLRLTVNALEKKHGVRLKLIQIPREIMERNRTSPPPWLEVAVLEAEPVVKQSSTGTTVDVKLTNFMPSLAEVPTKELEAIKERAVKSGFDFIDFWAIDFDWDPSRPFNHHWQDYRTRKDRSLSTVSNAEHTFEKPGTYTICVKVVDTFGCDTSITVDVTL